MRARYVDWCSVFDSQTGARAHLRAAGFKVGVTRIIKSNVVVVVAAAAAAAVAAAAAAVAAAAAAVAAAAAAVAAAAAAVAAAAVAVALRVDSDCNNLKKKYRRS